ncbi:MAG: glycosyltransferase family 2 protein [Anaerolineales bacterium]|jgi:glycosyltransferase involved in cell wall biosynthesis
MTKLIIQIPCFNEENTLPSTLQDLPRELPGVDRVEWLIIDDGSTDRTVEVARAHGVDHIVRHLRNLGLARAFMTGLEACIQLGADIIVNTDADNQYVAADIPKLIAPILSGKAQMVIGSRPIASIQHFSAIKKILQNIGSWFVRKLSNLDVPDAPSGFRALSREAAMQLHVFNEYTYTLETIIQAGHKHIVVTSVPIRTNPQLRSSRLIRSIPRYIFRSGLTMVRIFMTYQPFNFFVIPGLISFAIGILIGLRFLYFYLTMGGQGHIQSLILAAVLLSLGGFLVITGLLADLISVNRKLLEKIDWQLQKILTDDKERNHKE